MRRVAIIGAGAMGGSLAALMASHLPTVLVVRNVDRAERIRRSGIHLEGELCARGRPSVVGSVEALADIHPIDLVVIATKTTAIPEVCAVMRPHLSELPFVCSYQNGIEPGRTIMRMLGTHRVVRMVLHYGARLEARADPEGPLRIHTVFHAPPHFVGGEGPESLSFARDLASMLTGIGLRTEYSEDIDIPVWRKGLMNSASNAVSALLRAPLGELMSCPARGLIERLLDEGIAVASAAGIELGEGYREQALAGMERVGSHLPSMALDVMAQQPTEITQLNEQIAASGRKHGVPTPTHDAISDLIRTLDWRLERRPSAEHASA